jgi:hypothetical protein
MPGSHQLWPAYVTAAEVTWSFSRPEGGITAAHPHTHTSTPLVALQKKTTFSFLFFYFFSITQQSKQNLFDYCLSSQFPKPFGVQQTQISERVYWSIEFFCTWKIMFGRLTILSFTKFPWDFQKQTVSVTSPGLVLMILTQTACLVKTSSWWLSLSHCAPVGNFQTRQPWCGRRIFLSMLITVFAWKTIAYCLSLAPFSYSKIQTSRSRSAILIESGFGVHLLVML